MYAKGTRRRASVQSPDPAPDAFGSPPVPVPRKTEEEFRAVCTTAGGAYLLDRACDRLPEILRAVREPRHDPMAARRRTLKEYVLGPDRPTSMARFNAAVDDLADRAAAERAEDLLVPLA
jgi:hypothetical protein